MPSKCACNKFNKLVKSKANFEDMMNIGESSVEGEAKYVDVENEDVDTGSGSDSNGGDSDNQEEEEKSIVDKLKDWLK